MRHTRNPLVHEYFERPNAVLTAFKQACDFVDTLCADTQTPGLLLHASVNEYHGQNA